MSPDDDRFHRLLKEAKSGDESAMALLFDQYRKQLRQMVRLRLDRRLQGRVDPSDVIQDAYLEASQRLAAYSENEDLPFFLWLRLVVGQKLTDLHRHHLGVQQRDAGRDVSLYRGPMPQATSFALAAQLLGKMTTPSQAAMRAESKLQIQEALNAMDPIDREVLTLRHFEMLTNAETAKELELSQAAASNRYVRALKRMKEILEETRGENS
jgi:RNA polymerase sigma-70 factor (ECF subfamily)